MKTGGARPHPPKQACCQEVVPTKRSGSAPSPGRGCPDPEQRALDEVQGRRHFRRPLAGGLNFSYRDNTAERRARRALQADGRWLAGSFPWNRRRYKYEIGNGGKICSVDFGCFTDQLPAFPGIGCNCFHEDCKILRCHGVAAHNETWFTGGSHSGFNPGSGSFPAATLLRAAIRRACAGRKGRLSPAPAPRRRLQRIIPPRARRGNSFFLPPGGGGNVFHLRSQAQIPIMQPSRQGCEKAKCIATTETTYCEFSGFRRANWPSGRKPGWWRSAKPIPSSICCR